MQVFACLIGLVTCMLKWSERRVRLGGRGEGKRENNGIDLPRTLTGPPGALSPAPRDG